MTPQEAAVNGRDLYAELGVGASADAAAVKKAYRTIARTDHPDKKPGDAAAEERFKKASAAYEILSDDAKRKEYDEYRQYAGSPGGMGGLGGFGGGRGPGAGRSPGAGTSFNVQDLFGQARAGGGRGQQGGLGDMFGGLFGSPQPRAGATLTSHVSISFDAALTGTTVNVQGTSIRIPVGSKNGTRLRARGKGSPGMDGGPPGDLEVVVDVLPDRLFMRGDDDRLTVTVPITFTEAALGATITVPTWEPTVRGEVRLKVAAGSRSGSRMRVRGKGVPRPDGERGDLIVTVEVAVPQKLTKEQTHLLEKFALTETEDVRGGLL